MGVASAPDCIDLWPEHLEVWSVWQALDNAWNVVSGMNGMAYLGFDRSQAESIMRIAGIKKRDRLAMLSDLLTLEAAALPILNAR